MAAACPCTTPCRAAQSAVACACGACSPIASSRSDYCSDTSDCCCCSYLCCQRWRRGVSVWLRWEDSPWHASSCYYFGGARWRWAVVGRAAPAAMGKSKEEARSWDRVWVMISDSFPDLQSTIEIHEFADQLTFSSGLSRVMGWAKAAAAAIQFSA